MSKKIALTTAIATLTASIAASTEKLGKLQVQLDQFDLLESIGVDSEVEFAIGRSETRRNVIGRVAAVKSETVGEGEEAVVSRKFKVEYTPTGDEFDNTYAVITEAQVLRVVVEEVVEAPAETPEFDAPAAE